MNLPALNPEKLLGVLMLAFPVWPAIAIGSAAIFYVRHRNRIEPDRRVPVMLYIVAVIICGGGAAFLGVILGIAWACPRMGNLCGLVGFLVVGPIFGTLAIFLVGLALSLIPRPQKPNG
jgi:hypothetical protein